MSWIIFDVLDRLTQYSRKQETKIIKAIASNNIAEVKKLLQQGVDPNLKISDRNNLPLIFSVFEKNYFTLPQGTIGDSSKTLYRIDVKQECLRLLLEYGADPNLRDNSGRTALEIAILWCMPDIVKLLFVHGADPNLRDARDLTPLMKTAILGIKDARPIKDKLQIIMHSIDSGAEIDAISREGKTALMYATGNSRIEIVELLISSGASLSIRDPQGNRAADVIDRNVTPQQRDYLKKILTQPQLNLIKYKYREFIPEGDRLLNSLIN